MYLAKTANYLTMNFIEVFLIFLLEILGTRAVFDEPGASSLRQLLHSSSNITYFEPANYNKDSILNQHKAATKNPTGNVVIIEIGAFKRYFSLILKQDVNLFSQGPEVKLISQEKENSILKFNFNEFYTGKVSGDQSSSATGRIRPDGTFDGCFYTAGVLYHLEPASRYFINPLPFHSIVYQSQDVEFNSSLRVTAKRVQHAYRKVRQQPMSMSFQTSHFQTRSLKLSDNSTDAKTCTLSITADYLFYEHVGKGSVDEAIAEMVLHIADVDKIFRSTDFNGDGGAGDNIGMTIAGVTVYQDAVSEGILGKSSASIVEYLNKWSTFNHDKYCFALIFTYQDFRKHSLGLAWLGSIDIGGICSKSIIPENSDMGEMMSYNTGVVTFRSKNGRIPRKASLITVAHELGHGFGSEHDPSTKRCSPGGYDGNYIMYAFSTSGTKANNMFFSECSKAQMWPVIFNKGPKCFIADNKGGFCGNKLVEKGEECDCGLAHECHLVDYCCEPRNQTLGHPGCRLKEGHQCSPKKGPCCTNGCMYINLTNKVCKEETECSYQAYCNYNTTCPSAVFKSSNTTCNHGSNTCVDGECIGSICAAYGLQECQCTSYHLMCHVCCNDVKNGCVSVSTIFGGQMIKRRAGSTCNQDNGYCDEQGYCITVNTDNQLRIFVEAFGRATSKASVKKALLWLQENWYYIVTLVVGACLVAAWLKFVPIYRINPLEMFVRRLAVQPYWQRNSRQRARTSVNRHPRRTRGEEYVEETVTPSV